MLKNVFLKFQQFFLKPKIYKQLYESYHLL